MMIDICFVWTENLECALSSAAIIYRNTTEIFKKNRKIFTKVSNQEIRLAVDNVRQLNPHSRISPSIFFSSTHQTLSFLLIDVWRINNLCYGSGLNYQVKTNVYVYLFVFERILIFVFGKQYVTNVTYRWINIFYLVVAW